MFNASPRKFGARPPVLAVRGRRTRLQPASHGESQLDEGITDIDQKVFSRRFPIARIVKAFHAGTADCVNSPYGCFRRDRLRPSGLTSILGGDKTVQAASLRAPPGC